MEERAAGEAVVRYKLSGMTIPFRMLYSASPKNVIKQGWTNYVIDHYVWLKVTKYYFEESKS